MKIMKTTVALSLAVLVTFGASACTGTNPSNPSTSETQVAVEKDIKESVRLEAIKTLNKAQEIKESDEYQTFFKDISETSLGDAGDIAKMKLSIEKHADLMKEIKSLASMSDKTKAETLNMIAAYGSSKTFLDDEEFFGDLMDISAFDMGYTGTENKQTDISYEIIPGMVQEKEGVFSITSDYVYSQDKNDAILGFVASEKMTLILENNGKKIVFDQETETPTNSKPTEWYILQSDVKNAATQVESWIVSQKGRNTKITVEDNTLIDEFTTKSESKYKFKLDEGTRITVEGNANAYIITGTYEGSEEVVTYDNQKGGLQAGTPKKPEVEPKPKAEAGADYRIWKGYSDFTKQYQDDNSIDYVVDALNKDDEAGVSYEVTEKNGTKYIKVNTSESKISETKVFLIAHETLSK